MSCRTCEDVENVNASVIRTAPTCIYLLFHVRGECCAPTPDASRRGGLSQAMGVLLMVRSTLLRLFLWSALRAVFSIQRKSGL